MSCRIAQADGRIQIKPVDKGGGMAVMNVITKESVSQSSVDRLYYFALCLIDF